MRLRAVCLQMGKASPSLAVPPREIPNVRSWITSLMNWCFVLRADLGRQGWTAHVMPHIELMVRRVSAEERIIVLLGNTMYLDKTILCAAAGGAMALSVAWLLWDSRN